jgi:hypothetical protein
MGTEVEVTQLPNCNIHAAHKGDPNVPALYDGKTVLGPWANMCQECFDEVGVGLGTGRGQKLVVKTPGNDVQHPN